MNRRRRIALLAGLALCAWAGVAPAQLDVRFDAAMRVDGARPLDLAGLGVASAGDVNGDRVPDLVVGASGADNRQRAESGSAYVVFGRRDGGRIDLKRLGTRGFRIDGAARGDHAGLSVAGVGDVNRDGFGDVAVSALDANVSGRRDAGAAYVVFGKRDVTDVDLSKLGRAGFRILPGPPESFVGEVAAAGDVNGDRRRDLIVGAEQRGGSAARSGWAYVVFGKSDSKTVDLARLGRRGLLIEGPAERVETKAVGGGGDFNGDGRADVVVGAARADVNGRNGAGLAYVVFGRRRGGSVDLTKLGRQGVRLEGASARNSTGAAVAGGRDLNGDRLADVVIGAPGSDARERSDGGSVYVVFGRRRAATIDLADGLGDGGFRVDGERSGDRAGDALALTADANGDRLGDIVIGASRADAGGIEDAGSAYLVFGKATSGGIDLREPRADAVRIDGSAEGESVGVSVAGAGDLNRDGRGDVLAGAFGADSFGRESSGAAFVFLGAGP